MARRASAREQRGAREEALADVQQVLGLEPGNREAETQKKRLISP